MITFVRGRLIHSLPTSAVVDVGGVGYELLIPLSTFDKLPLPPADITLLTHLHVREDAHVLYGFYSTEERDLFRLLIAHVSGIGPRTALAILGGCSVANFRAAVMGNDAAVLSRLKGVGRKTAEKIILELRDKVGVSAAWEQAGSSQSPSQQAVADAVLGLIALGYKQADAHKAVRAAQQTKPDAGAEELIRMALRDL